MLSNGAAISVERTLLQISARSTDHVASQREALDALHHVVPFDVASFSTVDPATMLWTGCVLWGMERDASLEAFLFVNEYRQDDLHKIADLARNQEHARRLSAAPAKELERSPRTALLHDRGVADELRCALIDGVQCWGSIELYRGLDAGPFNDDEVGLVAHLSEPLARVVRMGLIRSAATHGSDVPNMPGVVVFDAQGGMEAVTPAGQKWIAEMDSSLPGVTPPAIRSLVLKVNRQTDEVVTMMAPRRSGGWLRLHAMALEGNPESRISVVVEPALPVELPETLAYVYGFTPRESEVITLMARGFTAKEIGGQMGISAFTVNDHSKAVFLKADVQSRQQLIAALFFDRCLPLREQGVLPGPCGWFLEASTSDRGGSG